MKVYQDTPAVQVLKAAQELFLMNLEDNRSHAFRFDQDIKSSFTKGRQDMFKQFLKDLSLLFGYDFSSDEYQQIFHKLKQEYINRESINTIQSIECSLTDLYILIKDTEKMVQLIEQGISNEGRVKLGKLKLNVRVKKNEDALCAKEDLSKLFIEETHKEYRHISTAKLDYEYFSDFSLIYPDITLNNNEIDKEFHCKHASPMSTQEMIALSYQQQQKKLLKEQEWENRESKLLKNIYKRKKKQLKIKENEQREIEKHFKRKNLEIEKERAEIERVRDSYNREKKRLLANYENKSRKISEFIDELTSSIEVSENLGMTSPIAETDCFSDVSSVSDYETSLDASLTEPDLPSLQKRIHYLESMYRTETSSETQERLKKDIDNLKNSITNIRSAQVLKDSNMNHKKFNFMKTMSFSEISKKQTFVCQSFGTPRLPLNSTRSLFKTSTVRADPVSQGFRFTEVLPEETEINRFLRVKEAKFSEKEEELDKERDSWMQKWSALPDAKKLLPMVQNEIIECRKKCREYDSKLNELEKKEFYLDLKQSEFSKREKEIEARFKAAAESKAKLADSKNTIVSRLERLKKELHR